MKTAMTARQLRQLRTELGLTQLEFAQKLGLTRQWIGALERGERPISRRVELELAHQFPLRVRA